LEGYFVFMENLSSSMCNGRHHYNIFSRIQIDLHLRGIGTDTEQETKEQTIRHAWKQLRYEQPQLAITADGMTKVYEVPADEAALDAWLTTTFIVSSASNFEDLYSTGLEPIQQSTLYYIPNSSELVLRALHSTLDGIGALMLWDSLLRALVSPRQDLKFGDEASRLAPAVEEVLGHPGPPRPEIVAKGAQLVADCVGAMPGIGPVSRVGTGAPSGASRNIEVVLSPDTTGSIIQACKTKGISVTAAIHAAYIRTLAIAHADPQGKQSQYVTVASFDFRSFLPEPYNSRHYASSVYYQTWGLMLDLPASFMELAQQLNTYYRTTFRDENGAEDLEISGSLTRALRDIVQTPEFLTSPVSRDALVSSLGVTEKYLQRKYVGNDVDIAVRDLKFGTDVVLGQSMFFVYTFREQLRLVYCFNEGFEEPENFQEYLGGVQKVLVEELLT
jgi:hypothetical protein